MGGRRPTTPHGKAQNRVTLSSTIRSSGNYVRPTHGHGLLAVLLGAVLTSTAGCYTDIELGPEAEGPAAANRPADDPSDAAPQEDASAAPGPGAEGTAADDSATEDELPNFTLPQFDNPEEELFADVPAEQPAPEEEPATNEQPTSTESTEVASAPADPAPVSQEPPVVAESPASEPEQASGSEEDDNFVDRLFGPNADMDAAASDEEATPESTMPQEPANVADVAAQEPASGVDDSGMDEWAATEDDPLASASTAGNDAAGETPPAALSNSDYAPLPWELPEAQPMPEAQEPTGDWMASEPPANDQPTTEKPTEEATAADEPPVDAMASADAAPRAEGDWKPARQPAAPMDSRQLTWLLASRLSYLLVAPEADLSAVESELGPVANKLEIELPDVQSVATGSAEQLKQALSVGQTLGQRLVDRFGADHAALAEVAFKSNLLLATVEHRPQLKHGINASVAAAAVRANLSDSVWQPFQNAVAEGTTAREIGQAVVELHQRVGEHLGQDASSNESGERAVLR